MEVADYSNHVWRWWINWLEFRNVSQMQRNVLHYDNKLLNQDRIYQNSWSHVPRLVLCKCTRLGIYISSALKNICWRHNACVWRGLLALNARLERCATVCNISWQAIACICKRIEVMRWVLCKNCSTGSSPSMIEWDFQQVLVAPREWKKTYFLQTDNSWYCQLEAHGLCSVEKGVFMTRAGRGQNE